MNGDFGAEQLKNLGGRYAEALARSRQRHIEFLEELDRQEQQRNGWREPFERWR